MSSTCKHEGCTNDVYPKSRECRPCFHNRRRYGLTTPERDDLLDQQGGICLICNTAIEFRRDNSGSWQNTDAAVDHCHTTGEVRGILCRRCNSGLGHFEDNTDRLQNAINYLSLGE